MKHEYTVQATSSPSSIHRLLNELGEMVFCGGLLECHELKGRYEGRADLVRGYGAPAADSDDAFTVRERTDRYGHIYDVVSVATGAIVRDGVGGTRYALTFASQSAACEWARWLNDGKPPLTRSRGVPGTATMGRL